MLTRAFSETCKTMAGLLNLNIGTSVFKRESKSIGDVESRLVSDGWEKTGSTAGGRIRYYEKSGINITALSGPAGTVIMPSGPVRGMIFGTEDAVGINRTSVIGAGSVETEENVQTRERQGELT